jgi:hypothetical protein
VDTCRIDALAGRVPAGLDRLAAGPDLLGPGYAAGLVFGADEVPVATTRDAAGRARVTFPLGGTAADVARFWRAVRAREDVLQITLAEAWGAIPATINPLAFLLTDLIRQNAVLVRIALDGVPADAPGLAALPLVRRILPPHVALLVTVTLPTLADTATAAAAADALFAFTPAPDLVETSTPAAGDRLTAFGPSC